MSSSNETDFPASVPPPPEPPAPAEPKPNSFERIAGVIMSPAETFESIRLRPDWVVPLAIIVSLALVSGILVSTRVDFRSLAREAMEMNPRTADIPADRLDSMVNFTAMTMRVSSYLNPFLQAIALLLVAAVLQVSFRLFGHDATFRQAFSTTLYAWMPRLIKGCVALAVIFSKSDLGIFDLQNPVMSNLGFLADPKTNPLLYAVFSSVDLFSIWSVILLVIGFGVITRASRGKSAAIVIGWWVVVNLFSLIGPAMQMLRR
jgi:hypothetical protein